mmetsp:Transcript_16464/g.19777  ORF Transcript_16464/g.19777 Transcript_16464/m.19777 type:complete len:125 (-) Transcript_16464:363-737(-)|eukprot:jgi/Bigna1/141804/aug1.65_g16512
MTKGINGPVKKKPSGKKKPSEDGSFKRTATSSGSMRSNRNKLQPMFGSGLQRVHGIIASLLGGTQDDTKAADEVLDNLASTDAANCLGVLSLGNGDTSNRDGGQSSSARGSSITSRSNDIKSNS